MKALISAVLLLFTSFTWAINSNFLFLQQSSTGELIKNKDHSYSLTLRDAPTYISYFTDKPKKQAGILPLSQFIELLTGKNIRNHFSTIPPNATIVMISNSGQSQNFIALLSKPHYVENATITYQLKIMSKDPILTGNMKYINMFIDDVHWQPNRITN
ncbi:Uncharacterised protein [Legionella busanensis]|uniref:Uncharacterized protein n=1 Tax=Legionella busanensis TaxID=190655 RepID=A0A378JIK1_9GAMM|nr:hypothetical protein [Legionella busanensis]STX50049.1 Uncharacterised protein [Legionella busanensis]